VEGHTQAVTNMHAHACTHTYAHSHTQPHPHTHTHAHAHAHTHTHMHTHIHTHMHTQGRLYRLFDLFALVEHKMLLSQMSLMLVRNFTYVFYIVHWMACLLYYVARVDGFTENSWLGREDAQARVEGQHLWVK